MTDFVVERFAAEAIKRGVSWVVSANIAVSRATESIARNRRITNSFIPTYSQHEIYALAVEDTYFMGHVNILEHQKYDDYLHNIIHTASMINSTIEDILTFRRTEMKRKTIIDTRLIVEQINYININNDMALSLKAISGDENATDTIYKTFINKQLEQNLAAYYFATKDTQLDIEDRKTSPTPGARGSMSALRVQAMSVLNRARKTNLDRKFIEVIEEYADKIDDNANVIELHFLSTRIKFAMKQYEDEIPPHVYADLGALLLSQDQVLRNFPEWKLFTDNSTATSNSDLDRTKNFLETVKAEPSGTTEPISTNAAKALKKLEAATVSANTEESKNEIISSSDNALKTTILGAITKFKNFRDKIVYNHENVKYIRFLLKNTPHLKLLCRSNEHLNYLVPLIDWIEAQAKAYLDNQPKT